MNILHIALGGCLTGLDVNFGLTEDTGGHLAYVLGAAQAQARMSDVDRVEIVTRAFDDPDLGSECAVPLQQVGRKLFIRRIATENEAYLTKDDLASEVPAICEAFLAELVGMKSRPDVIHAHFSDAAKLAVAAKKRFGIPFVYTPHSLGIDKVRMAAAEKGSTLDARIDDERDALRLSDAVVVSSRDEAERQTAAYDVDVEGKVHKVFPGVSFSETGGCDTSEAHRLIAPFLTDPLKPIILTVARPVRRKNLATLMRAYLSSDRLRDMANFVILAGQHGPCANETEETAEVFGDLRELASRPNAIGRVALPDTHTRTAVSALYTLARQSGGVFVNPALHEPFGLTILEAASHGLPTVATCEGGPKDIIAKIGHGMTITPTDTVQIAEGISHFLDSKADWMKASSAGVAGVRAFSWNTWAKRCDIIYRDLIKASYRKVESPRVFLASDMDGTLTGSRHQAAAFRDWIESGDIPFVIATGRSITEARTVLAGWSLPEPDSFVTAVGTEIYYRTAAGNYVSDRTYADCLKSDWNREAVADALSGFTFQADVEQRQFKFGLFGNVGHARRIRIALANAGLKVRVIASHGNLIDVVPFTGGKGHALAHVARRYGLTLRDCVAAGDSGNDIDMLEAAGRSIAVGNAARELAELKRHPHVYFAQNDFAGGVLEGLSRFGVGEDVVTSLRFAS